MTEVIPQYLVAIKSETTEGVDAFSGEPTEWLATETCTVTPVRTPYANGEMKANHSASARKTFGSHCDVELSGFLKGKSGAAGTAPAIAALLKASGLAETVVADTSVSYKPVTVQSMAVCPSFTIYKYERQTDGTYRLYKSFGVRGNFAVTYEMGVAVKWAFSGGKGSYVAPATATISGPSDPETYDGNKGQIPSDGMTLSIGGTAWSMGKFDFQTAWAVEEVRTATGSSQLDYSRLVRPADTPIAGNLEFMKSDELEDVLDKHGADTEFAVANSVTDGTDTIAFAAPKAQFDQWSMTAGNLGSFGVPVRFNGEWGGGESGDNDFTLTFT